jgi:hypothetical protein
MRENHAKQAKEAQRLPISAVHTMKLADNVSNSWCVMPLLSHALRRRQCSETQAANLDLRLRSTQTEHTCSSNTPTTMLTIS